MSQIACVVVDFDTPGDEIVVLANRIDEFQVQAFNVMSGTFVNNTKPNAAPGALALAVDIGQTTGPIPERRWPRWWGQVPWRGSCGQGTERERINYDPATGCISWFNAICPDARKVTTDHDRLWFTDAGLARWRCDESR